VGGCTGPKTKAGRARSVKAGREGLLRWWGTVDTGDAQQVHERGLSASGRKDAAVNHRAAKIDLSHDYVGVVPFKGADRHAAQTLGGAFTEQSSR
jgi:hypothetical protein